MSNVQNTRLIKVLDEDLNGIITYKELLNALSAFKCRSESSMPQQAEFMDFDKECFFKLLRVLRERRIKFSELFRMFDINDDGVIDLQEIEKVLQSFGEFKIIEVKTLFNAFDIDGNGTI